MKPLTREELVTSKEYILGNIQLSLFNEIENYLNRREMSRSDFAGELGFTKGYVSQIMSGEYDHKISKFVELSLAVGKVPVVRFIDIAQYAAMDGANVWQKPRFSFQITYVATIQIERQDIDSFDIEHFMSKSYMIHPFVRQSIYKQGQELR